MRRRRQSTVTILFELHATSADDERWIASGWRDSRLSTLGRRQAKALRERRAPDDEVDAVLTSDLARAADTARIAFGDRGIPVLHDWRLRECHFGDLDGAPAADVERVRADHVYDPFPGGESYVDVVARVRSFARDAASRFAERRIVVVGHAGTKIALDHVLEGADLPRLVAQPVRWQPGWTYALAVES